MNSKFQCSKFRCSKFQRSKSKNSKFASPTRPLASLIAIVILVTGCTIGPDYEQPSLSVADTYHASSSANSESVVDGDVSSTNQHFWQGFGDPLLADLLRETLHENLDLQAAMARYQGAAALLRLSQREQWPSLTAFAQASDQKLAAAENTADNAGRFDLYDAGVALHWEVDLFGRLTRATDAARANFEATGADMQALQVALAGQLATSYWQLRGLQQRYRVIEQNIALQRSSLDIVNARLDAGRGTTLDVLRAQAQLDTTRAVLPEIEAAIHSAMHRIAVLSGKNPATLIEQLNATTSLPNVVPNIAVGQPGEVLRRRPDIRAAERRVAAASARIGIASADLFPRFSLQGLAGSLASDTSDLFTSGNNYRRVIFGIDWTFLDRAQVRARIDAADAETAAQLAEYRQAVLLALEETETWLVRFQQSQTRVGLLQDVTAASEQAVDQARVRYEQGYIDYFELLSAELELARARDSLVLGQTEQALAMVNVYRSLAGAPTLAAEERPGVEKNSSVAAVTAEVW